MDTQSTLTAVSQAGLIAAAVLSGLHAIAKAGHALAAAIAAAFPRTKAALEALKVDNALTSADTEATALGNVVGLK